MILEHTVPPGRTIKEQIELYNWTIDQFAIRMGVHTWEAKALLAGRALLTPYIAVNLARVLGIPKEFWLNMEKMYRRDHPHMFKDHKFHIAMWEWLAKNSIKNPIKHKSNWPEWEENGGRVHFRNRVHCFACATTETRDGYFCDNCPIEWGMKERNLRPYIYCEKDNTSPYAKWLYTTSLEDKQKYANIIAHLPLAKGWASKV